MSFGTVIHLSMDCKPDLEMCKSHLVCLKPLNIAWKSFSAMGTLKPEETFHIMLTFLDMEARDILQIPYLSSETEWGLSTEFIKNNADFINQCIEDAST